MLALNIDLASVKQGGAVEHDGDADAVWGRHSGGTRRHGAHGESAGKGEIVARATTFDLPQTTEFHTFALKEGAYMQFWTAIAVAAFAAVPAVLDAQTSDTGGPGWKTYRNESGEYEIKYPNTLSLSIASGKTCMNGECKAVEEVMLMGSDSTDGKPSVKSMSFIIQRGINPVDRCGLPE